MSDTPETTTTTTPSADPRIAELEAQLDHAKRCIETAHADMHDAVAERDTLRAEVEALRHVPEEILALMKAIEPRAAVVIRLTCPNASALLVKLAELAKGA
jgi:hypothetical protein